MAFHRAWARVSVIAWLFPIVIMFIGTFFPSLWEPVSFAVPSVYVTPGLLTQVLLSGIWLLAEYRFAASRETAVGQLQSDAFRSIFLSLALSFGAGWLMALGKCPWLYFVPAVAAIGDAFLTANQGLNNAAQKPFIAPEVLSRRTERAT